ncbi:MAG: hypothetical protein HY268_02965 [Deltaproteobacteria bacterium]|nr:hypothetical protein [Deltaproteobacteria bacterium]
MAEGLMTERRLRMTRESISRMRHSPQEQGHEVLLEFFRRNTAFGEKFRMV